MFTFCLYVFLLFEYLGHEAGAGGRPAHRRAAEALWDGTDCRGVCRPAALRPDRGGVLLGPGPGEWLQAASRLTMGWRRPTRAGPALLCAWLWGLVARPFACLPHVAPGPCLTVVPSAALLGDRPAHRRPGRHGGPEHTAPGRGAEGGAAGRPHCGRLRPGEQDGEGVPGHPEGHRLHRLPVHPLRSGRACGTGVRTMGQLTFHTETNGDLKTVREELRRVANCTIIIKSATTSARTHGGRFLLHRVCALIVRLSL